MMIYLIVGWIVVFILLMFPEEFAREIPAYVNQPTLYGPPPSRGWTSGFT